MNHKFTFLKVSVKSEVLTPEIGNLMDFKERIK